MKVNNIINNLDVSMTNLKPFENSLALRFQEASKYDKFSFLQERSRIMSYTNPSVIRRAINPYKVYTSKPQIKLGIGATTESNMLLQLIERRRSTRKYEDYEISTNELYNIFHYSYGITGGSKIHNGEGIWHYRAVPSGGALYPLELYVFIHNSSIRKGLYHYRPDSDKLELILEDVNIKQISDITASGNINIESCSCIILITSVFQRNMIKYAERGYRFILQEVGEISQNISLICESMNLSSCILGGYIDDSLNALLNITPPMETIQGVIVIGKGQ